VALLSGVQVAVSSATLSWMLSSKMSLAAPSASRLAPPPVVLHPDANSITPATAVMIQILFNLMLRTFCMMCLYGADKYNYD
jgi:hypothetical protein